MEVISFFKPKESKGKFTEIPIDQIVSNPHQPRQNFSQDTLAELCDSIKQYGIIQLLPYAKEHIQNTNLLPEKDAFAPA